MIPRKKLVDPSTHVRDARLYIVVVEGANTEPAYFRALEVHDLIPKNRVKIHIVSPEDNKSAPRYLVNNAEKAKNDVGRLMADDEIWIVFDIDKHSGNSRLEQIHSALHDANSQGWYVALSNPCFEVWLLLHITDNLTGITDAGRTAEEKLRELLGGYNKSNTPMVCLGHEALRNAVTRAKTLDMNPDSPIPALPSTRVYRLVERLVGARVA